MFSGKSTELARRIRRHKVANKQCIVVKYAGDTRYEDEPGRADAGTADAANLRGCVITHDRQALVAYPARALKDVDNVVHAFDVVGIDEGQFFGDLAECCERWASMGKTVIVAALDADTETLCKQHNIPYHSDKDLRYTFDVMATGGQPLHDPNAKVTMEGRAFQQIGALKAAFLLFLLNRGHRVLVSDVDTVWLNDPREWFERDDLPTRVDVAVSTDCLSHEEEKRHSGCWGPVSFF